MIAGFAPEEFLAAALAQQSFVARAELAHLLIAVLARRKNEVIAAAGSFVDFADLVLVQFEAFVALASAAGWRLD